jgi:type IV secretion system protein VirD4
MNAGPLPGSPWPLGRRVAAWGFGVICCALLACGALYLSGVLFLLLNKANPRQADFASIASYWDLYSNDPALRKKLIGSIGGSALGLFVVLPGSLYAASRRQRPLHGDARFANLAEVARADLLGASGPSILIGRYRGQFLPAAARASASSFRTC